MPQDNINTDTGKRDTGTHVPVHTHTHIHPHLQVVNHTQIINHHLQQLYNNKGNAVIDALGNLRNRPNDISDLNWYIVKLTNNRRLSAPQISKVLAEEIPPVKLDHGNVSRHLRDIKKRYKDLVRDDYAPSKPLSPGELGKLMKEVTDSLTGLTDSLGFGVGQGEDTELDTDTEADSDILDEDEDEKRDTGNKCPRHG